MRAVAVLCAAVALAGCQAVPGAAVGQGDAPATKADQTVTLSPPKPACPPFRPWTDADRAALVKALAPVPADSIIIRAVLDWRRYYLDAEACSAAQAKPYSPSTSS